MYVRFFYTDMILILFYVILLVGIKARPDWDKIRPSSIFCETLGKVNSDDLFYLFEILVLFTTKIIEISKKRKYSTFFTPLCPNKLEVKWAQNVE